MIEVTGVNKMFGEIKALDNIVATIQEGSIFGLIGTNGAGKSTLLRVISGVLKPDTGMALIDGENVYENPQAKAKIFFLPDNAYFFQNATAKTMAEYYQVIYPQFDIPFLTFIYHFRAVVQLPECRSSGSHHIQIRFELIICHLVCQIGSCFSIDWIMVVNVCQWKLELSFFYKIKISAVTVRKQLIYLYVLSDLNTSDILAVLDPDRI